ncbi:hypothetical protein ABK040_014272 [Willaertia magna]
MLKKVWFSPTTNFKSKHCLLSSNNAIITNYIFNNNNIYFYHTSLCLKENKFFKKRDNKKSDEKVITSLFDNSQRINAEDLTKTKSKKNLSPLVEKYKDSIPEGISDKHKEELNTALEYLNKVDAKNKKFRKREKPSDDKIIANILEKKKPKDYSKTTNNNNYSTATDLIEHRRTSNEIDERARREFTNEIANAEKMLSDPNTFKDGNIVPFKSERLIKLWREGKIIPETLRERLVFEEKKDGFLDIYMKDDPTWSRFTSQMLTPTSTVLALEKLKLLSEDPNPEVYFKTRTKTLGNFEYLIRVQAVQMRKDLALSTFQHFKDLGLIPTPRLYNAVLSACAMEGDYKTSYGFLKEMQKEYSIEPDIQHHGCLVHALVRANKIEEAFQFVEVLRSHDKPTNTVIHTDLIVGCINQGDLERAWNHYRAMTTVYGCTHDEVTLSVMIHACAKRGQAERAMLLFNRFERENLEPLEQTYTSLIAAYAARSDLRHKAFDIAEIMEVQGYRIDLPVFSCLIKACAKDGNVQRMKGVLEKMQQMGVTPDEIVYNGVLHCYSVAQQLRTEDVTRQQNQNIMDSLAIYNRMKESGLKITHHTLNSLLAVFANALRLRVTMEILDEKFKENSLEPDDISYGILVRMYCRSRRTEKALELFDLMKEKGIKPTYQAYKHLIFRLVDEGNIELGRDYLRRMYEEGGFKLSPADIVKYKSHVMGAGRILKEREKEKDIEQFISSFVGLVDQFEVAKEDEIPFDEDEEAPLPEKTKQYMKHMESVKKQQQKNRTNQ